MRFIEDGPDIPDELLLALDKGEVIFFCGAGVSQAYAKLPGFLDLADTVLKNLRVPETRTAYKILCAAKRIEKKLDLPGLVSADRIFSELAKEFGLKYIKPFVAKALKRKEILDLTAHETLLDLATTKAGDTKIVTTNFDRLFEQTKKGTNLDAWDPPHLPVSAEIAKFEGLVYLHGRVNKKYDAPEKDFIISSSDFGRAYLTEGWARRFFKEIILEYTVVFIGYSADDPPIRYLLEARNKKSQKENKIYAFQSGNPEDASAKWEHKFATAIPYYKEKKDKHRRLWETLKKWADRMNDIEAWQDNIIQMAQRGPKRLSPFQREQVVQLVSTIDGAKRFCESNNPPPASWLCLFDSTIRFTMSTTVKEGNGEERVVDLLEDYGLDSDPVLKPIDPNDYSARRDLPPGALDAFEINDQDRRESQNNSFASLKGTQVLSVKDLPERFHYLGAWIAKVADQNAAIWWAVRQAGIHQNVQDKIRTTLRDKTDCSPHIVQAWHYLFDSWNLKPDDRDGHGLNWYSFESDVDKFGWDIARLKRYKELTKPWMVVRQNIWEHDTPPEEDTEIKFGQLVALRVSYSERQEISIPKEWLARIVFVWRQHLDTAILLEKETGYYPPISILMTASENSEGVQYMDGLVGAVFYYASLFKRLLDLNPQQAQAEVNAWDKEDANVYARLRIWSCQFSEIVADNALADFFATMPRKVFWDFYHQGDILYTIKARWQGASGHTRRAIERLILQGPEKEEEEEQDKYTEYKAWSALTRLDWLQSKDCTLTSATQKAIIKLKERTPKYKTQHGQHAADPRQSGVRIIHTNTEHSVLLRLSISDILPKAEKEMGKNDYSLDHNNPFAGLCETHPELALDALLYEANEGMHRAWAWRSFLQSEKRKTDSNRLKKAIAGALICLPDEITVDVMYAMANWLRRASKKWPRANIPTLERLTKRLIKILHENYAHEDFAMKSRGSHRDWGTDALNRPSGYIAQALFHDPRKNGLKKSQSFPRAWLDLVESMLALPDDLGRYALVFFTHNLHWFYYVDPQWTIDNLLQPLFDGNPDTTEAWWTGYLWGANYLAVPKLFQEIKPYLFARASNRDIQTRDDVRIVGQIILLNWGYKNKGKKRISDEELRAVLLDAGDNFRSSILWQIRAYCEKGDQKPYWNRKRNRLLKKVWPLERRAKTAKTTARLIHLAISDELVFPRLAKVILPLLGKITQGQAMPLPSVGGNNRLIDKHPEAVLAILYKVLSESATQWPYKIEDTLDRIATTAPELTRDPRFKELQRRWAAR